jgi:hypothetical protein
MTRTRHLIILIGSLALTPTLLEGQSVSVAATCSEGWSTLGALGISEFSCDCTFDSNGNPAWRFRGEPEIKSISSNGPAAGRLRVGDVLVAIDGMLITTRAAGARLAHLEPGEPLTLTVRRGNREIEVRITPDEPCDPPTPPPAAPVATPADVPTPRPPVATARGGVPVPRAPRATTVPGGRLVPPSAPTPPLPASSGAWFGFGISCHNCEMNVTNYSDIERAEEELRVLIDRTDRDNDSPEVRAARVRVRNLRKANTRWRFSEYPTLFSVDPGSPAADAGLRRGDVLLRIDGKSLLTAEGAGRFIEVEPGESVAFTYRRGGTERTVQVRAIDRPRGHLTTASGEGVADALESLERIQAERAHELDAQAARLHEQVARASGAGRSDANQQALVELRAELERLNTTHSVESQAQMERLRSELALVERARGDLSTSAEDQHLRFAGSVGNTEVEVRGLSSVEVSYDNSTGELLIRTLDSTIRVKAPVGRR